MLQHKRKETTIVRLDFSVKKSELFLNLFKKSHFWSPQFQISCVKIFSSVEASKNIFSVACYTSE